MDCPKCKSEIRKDEINIQTDLGHCNSCGHIFKVSEVVLGSIIDTNFSIDHAPKGAWVNEGLNDIVIGATTRSAMAFFIIPFMMVWSGFSIGGLYGSQIISGKFDLVMSLFGIPFLIGSVIFWAIGLMTVFGKVELTLNKVGGTVFTGIGIFGKKKKFNWSDVDSIKEMTTYNRKGSNTSQLSIEGKTRTKFGMFLNPARMYFIMNAFKYYQEKLS